MYLLLPRWELRLPALKLPLVCFYEINNNFLIMNSVIFIFINIIKIVIIIIIVINTPHLKKFIENNPFKEKLVANLYVVQSKHKYYNIF